MAVRMWMCQSADCTVMLFRTATGCCRLCGRPGEPMEVDLKGGK